MANPLLGLITDRIVDAGGRAILGETLEWLGAEHLLAARAATPSVAQSITTAAVNAREAAAVAAGVDLLGTNPTPTNIQAGLSTIEEKSLGSIAKSGSRRIEGMLGYAEPRPRPLGHGRARIRAGIRDRFRRCGRAVDLVHTGVGNSYVSRIAPTLKVSANLATCRLAEGQIDFDASTAFTGEIPAEDLADDLVLTICDIAGGTASWGEILGEGDEVVSRFGAAL